MTPLGLSDPAAWVAYHGIATKVAGQGHTPTTYAIGSTVEATDWDPDPECGPGLHFSPTPSHASLYYQGIGEPRFLACEVDVASLVPLGNKCKAPSCRVLREVDIHADPNDAADIQKVGVA